MGLSIQGLKSGSSAIGGNTSRPNGIFVSKAKIATVEAFYNEQQRWQKKPDDLGLMMCLDIGRDFQPEFYVGGMLKRTEFGDVVGIGTIKKIDILLTSLGIDADISKDDLTLLQSVLDEFIGREFLRLSYVSGVKDNGKPRWSDWQETRRVGTDYDDFTASFLKAVANEYVKNYRPDSGDSFVSAGEDLAL